MFNILLHCDQLFEFSSLPSLLLSSVFYKYHGTLQGVTALIIRSIRFLILHFYLHDLKPIIFLFISSFISQTEGSSQIIVNIVFTSNISWIKKKKNTHTHKTSSLSNQQFNLQRGYYSKKTNLSFSCQCETQTPGPNIFTNLSNKMLWALLRLIESSEMGNY